MRLQKLLRVHALTGCNGIEPATRKPTSDISIYTTYAYFCTRKRRIQAYKILIPCRRSLLLSPDPL